jgi:hypothetical protein
VSAPFEGVLAVIGKSTRDGRVLAPHDPLAGNLTRDLPLVIQTHEGVPDGRIDRVWIDGNLIRYEGRISDVTAKMIRTKLVVAGMDVDRAEFEVRDDDLGVTLIGWRVVGATIDPYDQRAWDEVSMTILDEPEQEIDSVNVPAPGDHMVSVPREELEDLRGEVQRLRALEAAGVDNWSGYDHAMSILREERDE